MADAKKEEDDSGLHRDEVSIHRLMDQLLNLNKIVSLGGHIVFDENLYNLKALPSYEIETIVAPYTDKLFEVVSIGDHLIPYVIMNPIVSSSFDSIDSFLKESVTLFDILLNHARTVSPEPRTVERAQGFIYDPDSVGIPMEALDQYPVFRQRVTNALQAPCTKLPANGDNIHFRKANIAMPSSVASLKNMYTEMLLVDSSQVRRDFIRHWKYTNGGKVPDRAPTVISRSHLFYPLADPRNMNLMFAHMPLGMQLSFGLVAEILSPSVTLTPALPTEISSHGAGTTNSVNVIGALNNVGLVSTWDSVMSAYLSWFVAPGFVSFHIDLSQYTSLPIDLVALLLCKMMFAVGPGRRYTNIECKC
jgi:hypothetical protein